MRTGFSARKAKNAGAPGNTTRRQRGATQHASETRAITSVPLATGVIANSVADPLARARAFLLATVGGELTTILRTR